MPKKKKVPKEATPLQSRLGATVRKHRQQLGITQEELAWRADMHRTYLADIERGVRNVTLRSITNLAKALQLTVENLLLQTRLPDGLMSLAQAGKTPINILLVEDDPQDVTLTLRAFQRVKFTNKIDVVRDGAEALDYLFEKGTYAGRTGGPPQLVLLDLRLPKVSGIEVLRMMKAHPKTRAIPVVVLTVARDDENIIVCSKLGASRYIIKPVIFENFAVVTSQMDFQWTLNQISAADSAPTSQ